MSVTANFAWTPESITRLRELAKDEGLSATDIGDRLGVSRGSIIGKCGRLGIALPRAGNYGSGERRRKHVPADHTSHSHIVQKCVQARKSKPAPVVEPPAEATEAVDLPAELIPADQRKTLYELNEHTCRWPIGDPTHADFHFCGAGPEANRPYCAGHCRMAYETPAQRKARLVAWSADQKARAAA